MNRVKSNIVVFKIMFYYNFWLLRLYIFFLIYNEVIV